MVKDESNNIKKIYFRNENFVRGKGFGQVIDSLQTPLGRHYVRGKIGEGIKKILYLARRFTGTFSNLTFE